MEHEHEAFIKLETDTTYWKTSPTLLRITDTPVSKISLQTLCGKKRSRNEMDPIWKLSS